MRAVEISDADTEYELDNDRSVIWQTRRRVGKLSFEGDDVHDT
jgi:hypothetical protein